MTELEKAQAEIWRINRELEKLTADKKNLELNQRLPALQQLGIVRGKCIRLKNAGLPVFEAEEELRIAQKAVEQVEAEVDDLALKIQLAANRLQAARGYFHKINNSNAMI